MAEIEFLPPPRALSSDEPESQRVEPIPAAKVEAGGDSGKAQHPAIRFRPLTPDEIAKFVAPDYAANGGVLPDPAISAFIGAFEEGKEVSYICLQLKLHAQPLVLRHGQQSSLLGLLHAAEEYILRTTGPQWVYAFTPAGKLSQLAATAGMQLEPWCVYSKLVQPELPPKPALELVHERVSGVVKDLEIKIEPEIVRETIYSDRAAELLAEYGVDVNAQARPDDSAWDSLFPNGVMGIDPTTGRVQ